MDTRDGRIYQAEVVSALPEEDRQYMKPMAFTPTPYQRRTGRIGRNDPCGCGSGKKFKKCCLFKNK